MASAARTALVTGATRGLGLETARQLADREYRVIATGRDVPATRQAIATLAERGLSVSALEVPLDVADPDSIGAAAEHLRSSDVRIDVLVNNAGVSMTGFGAEVARRTLDVNFFGPLRVTEALLPRMPRGGVVVMVSSGMGELAGLDPKLRDRISDPALTREGLAALMNQFVDDVTSGRHRDRGWPTNAYRVSKIGLNALVRVWAAELAARGIAVNAVCPGWVRTDMGGPGARRTVDRGAASIVWAATLPGEPTGAFFRDGHRLDW